MGNLLKTIFSKVIGLLVFLIVLLAMNFLIPYVGNGAFTSIVYFMNSNLKILLLISLFFGFGDIFYELMIPVNFLAPLLNSLGALYLSIFVFRIFGMIDGIIGSDILEMVSFLRYYAYAAVFFIVLIVGYFNLIRSMLRPQKQARTAKRKAKEN